MSTSEEFIKKRRERVNIWKKNNPKKVLAEKKRFRIKNVSKIKTNYLKSDNDIKKKKSLW